MRPSPDSPLGRVLSVYHAIPAIVRDVAIAVLVILLLMSGLWIYTAQPITQAPLVVVESGSMMHEEASWGRLGTIDPGDLILVKSVDGADPFDVVTLHGARAASGGTHPGEGGRDGYGADGDVVIFRQDQCPRNDPTPIIHRAVTWVEVSGSGANRRYAYHNADGVWLEGQASVHLPAMSITNNDAFQRSGWITKGDNPQTNKPADQAGICRDLLVQPDWLIGKARGEIPWVGLLKFIVQGNNVNNAPPDWCTPGKAVAPCDLFQALFLTLFILVAIPLVWDLVHRLRRRAALAAAEESAVRSVHDAPPRDARPQRPLPPRPPPHGPPRWARDDDNDDQRR